MTLHRNTFDLIANGFKFAGVYNCISKGEPMMTIECLTNGSVYLVRTYSRRSSWDFIYDNKNQANAKVINLRNQYSYYKRVR